MGGLLVDNFKINSKSGFYSVFFTDNIDIGSLGSHYIVDKNVFIINGEYFDSLGMSGKDTRIAILELLLRTTNAILVKE